MNKFDSYEECVAWMFRRLPMYQNQGKKAYRKDLGNIHKLDLRLGHPHRYFKSVHVAGTNGKGTTCHLLASVLQEAGYKVGLYTSPHIKDYRERIKVNGNMIEPRQVLDFVNSNIAFFEKENLSFFEMTVGLAFDHFSKEKVDVAIIEVGLGGRLDSTNIIRPVLSVITSIDLDHTDILGDTLEKIANEKAGIIKSGIPVVIGEQRDGLRKLFKEICKEKTSSIHYTENSTDESYFQWNVNTAIKALNVLSETHCAISKHSIVEGVQNVVKNTGLKGRYQVIKESPKVIIDVSHNAGGLRKLFEQVGKESYEELRIVFGSVVNRNLLDIMKILPDDAHYYLCEAQNDRAMPLSELTLIFERDKKAFISVGPVNESYDKAIADCNANDLLVITGSTFILSEII